jgi:secretion/DNA translocation related CpaE-like protein
VNFAHRHRPGRAARTARAGRVRSDAVRPDVLRRGIDPSDPLHSPRPLVATGDEELLDELLRLTAVAGLVPEVAPDAGSAARHWRRAPLVLVGSDLAESLAALDLPARHEVVLVSTDLDDASVWQRAVEAGAQHVALLPDGETWLVEQLTAVAQDRGGPGAVVAVLGGRGGAGASVLATALAITARRRGDRVLLVDGDPLGGGLDLLLGGEHARGLRWPDLAETRGRVDSRALYDALPRVDELSLLSWDRSDGVAIAPGAMAELLAAGRRGCDLTVVDLPRRLDAAAREALAVACRTLLVVPAEIRATAAAARVAAALAAGWPEGWPSGAVTTGPGAPGSGGGELQLVVRGPAPSGLPAKVIADSLGLPLAGELAAEPHLAEDLERGDPPARRGRGPLAEFCDRFLDELFPALG